ncbi:hypothetical protein KDL01_29460 [Actinospica durhamensis]|uniref:Uncharacterized protein n=1 Tax=Actinospica durhamensis TaxID=1508375 RepID=A0A941EUF9_9ACTN|nr:hypothetical protein [Actinospica durhamensis]MBR7837443.1 hypothetical protein [Actinospica durhamensis]
MKQSKPDAASILAGLVFMAVGLVYLLSSSGHGTSQARWTISLLVLGLGITAVVGVLTRRRR